MMARSCRIEIRSAVEGRGVFAVAVIPRGATILTFQGPRHDRPAVERAAAEGAHDGFLQAGTDVFIGLSGGPDDFVNHACEPNCYVRYGVRRTTLRALRRIVAGEELTFDYGLTQIAFPFRFPCRCQAAGCRGEIGDCDEIPADLIEVYRRAGAVPDYVEASLAAREHAA